MKVTLDPRARPRREDDPDGIDGDPAVDQTGSSIYIFIETGKSCNSRPPLTTTDRVRIAHG
jgi:hypothetical protein